MIVSADELKGHLRENFGIDPGFPFLPVFGDSAYEYVDEDWFHGEYIDRLAQFHRGFHPKVPWFQRLFRQDVFDCDDYTRGDVWLAQGAAWLAQVMHREQGKRIGAKAVAEFWHYQKGQVKDHAKAMGVFSPTRIGFIELQTLRKATWDRDEEKCTWYRF